MRRKPLKSLKRSRKTLTPRRMEQLQERLEAEMSVLKLHINTAEEKSKASQKKCGSCSGSSIKNLRNSILAIRFELGLPPDGVPGEEFT